MDPPGEARPDLDIFVEYARRLGLRDRDGEPLIKWTTAEEAFAAFGEMTRGRLCDYSGLSHDRLRGSPGIQWPCNESHPDGTERLYTDHVFETFIEECEDVRSRLPDRRSARTEGVRRPEPRGPGNSSRRRVRPSGRGAVE